LLGGKIVVGIDPAKASHQAAVVDATGAWVAPYGNAFSSPAQTEAVPDFDLRQSMGVSFLFKPYLRKILKSFSRIESHSVGFLDGIQNSAVSGCPARTLAPKNSGRSGLAGLVLASPCA
jgi:hypothetical protein